MLDILIAIVVVLLFIVHINAVAKTCVESNSGFGVYLILSFMPPFAFFSKKYWDNLFESLSFTWELEKLKRFYK